MAEEIFSEVERTAEDGALAKILFYDIVRQCRFSAAILSVDATNCHDSIAHTVASIIFQACGVPIEGVEAMLSAIQDMKYFLRAAYGDSTNFRGSKIEIKYQGLCQGNGAAPAGWAHYPQHTQKEGTWCNVCMPHQQGSGKAGGDSLCR